VDYKAALKRLQNSAFYMPDTPDCDTIVPYILTLGYASMASRKPKHKTQAPPLVYFFSVFFYGASKKCLDTQKKNNTTGGRTTTKKKRNI